MTQTISSIATASKNYKSLLTSLPSRLCKRRGQNSPIIKIVRVTFHIVLYRDTQHTFWSLIRLLALTQPMKLKSSWTITCFEFIEAIENTTPDFSCRRLYDAKTYYRDFHERFSSPKRTNRWRYYKQYQTHAWSTCSSRRLHNFQNRLHGTFFQQP